MKRLQTRLLSVLLVLVMVFSMIPTSVLAAAPEMTLRASQVQALAGREVQVRLDLENNPGLASLKVKVAYDDILTLTDVTFNEAMGGESDTSQRPYTSPVSLGWFNGFGEFTEENATFAILTFQVAETAAVGDVAVLSITHNPGDVFDKTETDIPLHVVAGSVTVADCIPGDINNSGGVPDMKDVNRLFQYVAWDGLNEDGSKMEVNELVLNTNGEDGDTPNMKDVTRLFQYVLDWDVELHPLVTRKCSHQMTEVAYKAYTCTEDGNIAHWHCGLCGLCFSDELGNTEIPQAQTVLPAAGHKEVAYGLDGIKCETCGEIIKVSSSETRYNITYDLYGNDTYLKTLTIENPNPSTYVSELGLTLEPLEAEGYRFLGWEDGYGESIRTIPAGTAGNLKLYAKWAVENTYTVHFMSEGKPIQVEVDNQMVSTVTYPSNKQLNLPEATMQGYVFLCWTNDNNDIVSSVNPGSRGEVTVYANWTSERNQARAVKEIDKPIVIEDEEKGQLLFVYELGEIINVPLDVIQDYGNVLGAGLKWENTTSEEMTYSNSRATEISNTIAEATTRSSAWTLSEDWNDLITCDTEHGENQGSEAVETIRDRVANGENWNVSSSHGGSFAYTKNTGNSTQSGSTNTVGRVMGRESSSGGSSSETESKDTNWGVEAHIGSSLTIHASAKAKVGVPGNQVEAGGGYSATVASELGGHFDQTNGWSSTHGTDWSSSSINNTTTDFETNKQETSYTDTSHQSESNWNSTTGYAKSLEVSQENEVSNAISREIYEKYRYSSTNGHNTSQSQLDETSDTSSESREYSTTTEYTAEIKRITETKFSNEGAERGYYRLVKAGTVHVFAVVGYDIATNTYYTYTYNIVDDQNQKLFFDYSLDDPQFRDRENGVLPFEIPYGIHEIVGDVVKKSEGLTIDSRTGEIVRYNGIAEAVVVPDYISVDNGDGTFSAVKVTGISSTAFRGNTSIKAIKLGRYITSIPDGAFKDCTNLETVVGYGMTEIGEEAFSGCTAIEKFKVSPQITRLGENAFRDVPEITVTAYNTDVAEAAIQSGARKINLYLNEMTDSFGPVSDGNRTLTIPAGTERFALYGLRKTTLTDTILKSDADVTVLNGVTFDTDNAVVLNLSSPSVHLTTTTVKTNATAMVLTAPQTEVLLQNGSLFETTSPNAIISRSTAYNSLSQSETGQLTVQGGNVLACGTVTQEYLGMLSVKNGTIQTISEEQYNRLVTPQQVKLDPNGGTLTGTTTMTMMVGQTYGALPIPSKQFYSFAGWYTAPSGGNQVTDGTMYDGTYSTLYAQWSSSAYTVSWSNVTGCTIQVQRTASPQGASKGNLQRGDAVYQGDVLTITYTPGSAYKLDSHGETSITVGSKNVTGSEIYANVSVKEYKVSWNSGTGYSVTVRRTSSPEKKAETGNLKTGDAVYYNDVLSITYTADTGYNISGKSSVTTTPITVRGDVGPNQIKTTATKNSRTFTINFKGSDGEVLGSAQKKMYYGDPSYPYSPPDYPGWTTPNPQTIAWSNPSNVLTFEYSPKPVQVDTMSGENPGSNGRLQFSADIEYQKRTATSVEVRLVWTTTLTQGYNANGQRVVICPNGISASDKKAMETTNYTQIVKPTWWKSPGVSYARSETATTGWVKFDLTTKAATTVDLYVYHYQVNQNGTNQSDPVESGRTDPDSSYTGVWTINIPAY